MRNVQMAKIVALGIAAAVVYGIGHDQISAHVCVEYFIIAHPRLFGTTSSAVLGICWGIAASVGIGAILGMLLAVVSQSADAPPVPIRHLLRSIVASCRHGALGIAGRSTWL
jgi:hypothetical protein